MQLFRQELIASLAERGYVQEQNHDFRQPPNAHGVVRVITLEPQSKPFEGKVQVGAGITIPSIEAPTVRFFRRTGPIWVADALEKTGGGNLLAKTFGMAPAATLSLIAPIEWFDGSTTNLNEVIALLSSVDSLVKINEICSAPRPPWTTWHFRGAQNTVRRLILAERLVYDGELSEDSSSFELLEEEFATLNERHFMDCLSRLTFEQLRAVARDVRQTG